MRSRRLGPPANGDINVRTTQLKGNIRFAEEGLKRLAATAQIVLDIASLPLGVLIELELALEIEDSTSRRPCSTERAVFTACDFRDTPRNWTAKHKFDCMGGMTMTRIAYWMTAIVLPFFAALSGAAISAQDKYTVQVPGGLSFSEFKGYEDWQAVSISKTEHAFALILANPVMIEAYRSGVPGNGKPFPEGSKIAKVHYKPVKSVDAPDPTTEVPGEQANVDFIVKDSKRFTDPESGGWGYAAFNYDTASNTFTPGTEKDPAPQGADAKCGVACHTLARTKDYVFTAYSRR